MTETSDEKPGKDRFKWVYQNLFPPLVLTCIVAGASFLADVNRSIERLEFEKQTDELKVDMLSGRVDEIGAQLMQTLRTGQTFRLDIIERVHDSSRDITRLEEALKHKCEKEGQKPRGGGR